ncbi:PilZ domain-containing protein [Leptospira gomenensis]|uniref:PilZ domain-containing protein n=1 Tax=Leptospira gomenensis TaxID=2484974 RepID=A0A5F1Y9Q5_9LEPT|nr:PilZ domain-containing protein [Leptospira gomenensis]TGK31527.1 PilZ domain-containing protein [Leptospira gomenensis]TGK44177.1 PilZ domain-containing protein [Leptospira gomenensis]TGK46232.1 PilZ domain-containing protein [Leptospira gomenensis]TGK54757.1 PilZ domain-containing protein [Leptospira gomenensis]
MDKIINDPEAIHKILQSLFTKLPVAILVNGRPFPARVAGLKDAVRIVVTLPSGTEPEPSRTLFLIHNHHRFAANFKVEMHNPSNGVELLQANSIHVSTAQRAEQRIHVDPSANGKTSLTNIINQTNLRKTLGFADKKIDEIVKKHAKQLRDNYPFSGIFFSDRMDNRLRLMYNFDQPIFVSDRTSRGDGSGGPQFLPFSEYLKLISVNKLEARITSEISIMIRYKGYTPLGYIQILSEKELTTNDFNSANIAANAVSKEIIASGFFQESKEKCAVDNISLQGLGFFHPQSIFFSRSFTVGETILFDLNLDAERKGTFRAVIRNINNTDKTFRIGCEFFNLNEREENMIQTYVDSKETES